MALSGKLFVMGLVAMALGSGFALGRATTRPVAANAAAAPPLVPAPAPAGPHDAVVAAPRSHRVLLENDRVRVLEVSVAPGEREPLHTHVWPSVMYIDEAAPLLYYDASDAVRFDGRNRPPEAGPETQWMRPEPLHSVENVGTSRFHAIRVELKP